VHRRWTTLALAGLTLVVLAISVPGALRDAYDRGGIYLFSRAFFENIPARLTGPGRLRFVFRPRCSPSSSASGAVSATRAPVGRRISRA